VGGKPQQLRVDAEPGRRVLGDGVIFLDGASVHRATKPGESNANRPGAGSLLIGQVHVGHHCVLGSEAILANAALLGAIVISGPGRSSAAAARCINSSASADSP